MNLTRVRYPDHDFARFRQLIYTLRCRLPAKTPDAVAISPKGPPQFQKKRQPGYLPSFFHYLITHLLIYTPITLPSCLSLAPLRTCCLALLHPPNQQPDFTSHALTISSRPPRIIIVPPLSRHPSPTSKYYWITRQEAGLATSETKTKLFALN